MRNNFFICTASTVYRFARQCVDILIFSTKGDKAAEAAMASYVGFANLPNQVHRKSVKKGFEFTLMVVGKFNVSFLSINKGRCLQLCLFHSLEVSRTLSWSLSCSGWKNWSDHSEIKLFEEFYICFLFVLMQTAWVMLWNSMCKSILTFYSHELPTARIKFSSHGTFCFYFFSLMSYIHMKYYSTLFLFMHFCIYWMQAHNWRLLSLIYSPISIHFLN